MLCIYAFLSPSYALIDAAHMSQNRLARQAGSAHGRWRRIKTASLGDAKTRCRKCGLVKKGHTCTSCENCGRPDDVDKMLLCDRPGCSRGWHIFCLDPPLLAP